MSLPRLDLTLVRKTHPEDGPEDQEATGSSGTSSQQKNVEANKKQSGDVKGAPVSAVKSVGDVASPSFVKNSPSSKKPGQERKSSGSVVLIGTLRSARAENAAPVEAKEGMLRCLSI